MSFCQSINIPCKYTYQTYSTHATWNHHHAASFFGGKFWPLETAEILQPGTLVAFRLVMLSKKRKASTCDLFGLRKPEGLRVHHWQEVDDVDVRAKGIVSWYPFFLGWFKQKNEWNICRQKSFFFFKSLLGTVLKRLRLGLRSGLDPQVAGFPVKVGHWYFSRTRKALWKYEDSNWKSEPKSTSTSGKNSWFGSNVGSLGWPESGWNPKYIPFIRGSQESKLTRPQTTK